MMAGDREKDMALLKRDARRRVTQLVSGAATTGDFADAERWRHQSAAHEAAFDEATKLWQNFGAAGRALLAEEGQPVWPGSRTGVARPRVSRRAILGGAGMLAAASAAYAVIDPPLGLWPSLDELRADYRTATGEQRRLTLADDVSVRMNTQTSLAIPTPAGSVDQINLIAGEASFAMPSRPTRPLAVMAEGGLTSAKQARFDVRNIGGAVCVTCLAGEVRVEMGGRAVVVGASQQLRYDRGGFGDAVAVNSAEVSAWQDGVLIFRFAPLTEVVAEINRYRPGRVILLNTALATKTINGRFKIARIDEVLFWIEQVLGATPRPLPGGVVLLT